MNVCCVELSLPSIYFIAIITPIHSIVVPPTATARHKTQTTKPQGNLSCRSDIEHVLGRGGAGGAKMRRNVELYIILLS